MHNHIYAASDKSIKEETHEDAAHVVVSAFFFGVADFFAAVFLGAAFFAGASGLATLLVTRPDLVLPSTFGTSTTAGACKHGVRALLQQAQENNIPLQESCA